MEHVSDKRGIIKIKLKYGRGRIYAARARAADGRLRAAYMPPLPGGVVFAACLRQGSREG